MMRKLLLAALAAVMILGLVLVVRQSRHHEEPTPKPLPESAETATSANPEEALAEPADQLADGDDSAPEMAPGELAPTNQVVAVEDQVDSILQAPGTTQEKAEKLLDLLPRAEPAAQPEVAQHLANLLEDDQFARVGPVLTNRETPEMVANVLLMDLMNRSDAVKLPMTLAVASVEEHPLQGDAVNLLKTYLGEDHGTNWMAWQQAIEAYLNR